MKKYFFALSVLLIALIISIQYWSSPSITPLELKNCLATQSYSLSGVTDQEKLSKQFQEIAIEIGSQPEDDFWVIDRQCQLSENEKLVAFTYTADSGIPRAHFQRNIYTIFGVVNKKNIISSYISVACPFGDDVGSASILEQADTKLLVDCSSGSSAGLLSDMYWQNYEFHIIDFSDFSSRLAWRHRVFNPRSENITEELIDNTEGLPEEWSKYFQ